MARQLRIEYPGAFYHVLNRGVERRQIFEDRLDYQAFLALGRTLYHQLRFRVHSYCLMPNHYHLFIETPEGNLSRLMHRLDGSYTQQFNRRHQRVGPLFQGRYKAILIDKESYSLELARYIHLNPVRAKLVERPEEYEWSSYSALLGRRKPELFVDADWLLLQFGSTRQEAREAFRRFNLEGLDSQWDPFKTARGGNLLGSEAFVDWVRAKFIPTKADRSIARLRELRSSGGVDEIVAAVERLRADPRLKRKLLLYALRRFTSLRLKETGAKVGGVSEVAVSQVVRRLDQQREVDQHLARLMDTLDAACGASILSNVEP